MGMMMKFGFKMSFLFVIDLHYLCKR
jgi:hypothetical protein